MSDLHPVFIRAKEILLMQGWYCGACNGPQGERCIIIACADAFEEIYDVESLWPNHILQIHRILEGVLGIPVWTVPEWNDTPGRTLGEVINALDQAIILTAPVVELVGSC